MNPQKIDWKMPFVPKGAEIYVLPADNEFLQKAKTVSEKYSLDKKHRTGAVIIRDGLLVGQGANGTHYHEEHGCKRKELGIPTGQGYELCPGCSPKNHAEQKAIRNAEENQQSTVDADLFLWGHWWCCESCWNAMQKAKIKRVFLVENAYELFKNGNGEN